MAQTVNARQLYDTRMVVTAPGVSRGQWKQAKLSSRRERPPGRWPARGLRLPESHLLYARDDREDDREDAHRELFRVTTISKASYRHLLDAGAPPEEVVIAYHERTNRHFYRFAASLGCVDWATQPDPFRRYPGADLIRLPILLVQGGN
jgi:hypothetical protein